MNIKSLNVKLAIIIASSMLICLISGSFLIINHVKNSQREAAELNFRNVVIQSAYLVENLKQTLKQFESEKMMASDKKLTEIVQIGINILKNYYEQYKAGKLTESEAKAKALAELRKMDFGKGGYFFTLDSNCKMLEHAKQPEHEGKIDFWKQKRDRDGVYFIQEMVKGAIAADGKPYF